MKDKIYKLILLGLIPLFIGCNTGKFQSKETPLYLTAPQHFEYDYNKDWKRLHSSMINTDSKVIIIYWKGNGGWSNLGNNTIEAIKKAKRQGKTIILELVGDGVSMHANVACHASRIIWKTNILIFHSGFFGHRKDGSKIYSNDRSYLNYCVSNGPLKGILNHEDIDNIIKERKRVEVSPTHHKTLPDYP